MITGSFVDELLGFLMFLLALMVPLGGAALFVTRRGKGKRRHHAP